MSDTHGYLTEPEWFTDERLRMARPTFAQLLETGLYTVEQCVAILEGFRDPLPPEHLDDSADHAEAARNGEDWWRDSR